MELILKLFFNQSTNKTEIFKSLYSTECMRITVKSEVASSISREDIVTFFIYVLFSYFLLFII